MSPAYFIADVASTQPAHGALVQSSAGILAVLLTVLAIIFQMQKHAVFGRVFKIIPALVFCYFVPTTLTAVGLLPAKAELYEWVKDFVLPASLILLTLSLDVRGIIGLGPKAGVMFLAGTLGVVIGAPIALLIWHSILPEDAWRQMSYIAGSWIGGGANAVALQQNFKASDAAIAPIIVVDVAVANVWMGMLLILVGRQARVDRWLKSDTSAITVLEEKMQRFHERVVKIPTLSDLLLILAIGFGVAWGAHILGKQVDAHQPAALDNLLGPFAWKVILATTVGVILSFTRARNLEGAGASRMGSTMIYVLVATIGAKADFHELAKCGAYLGLGATWMVVHISVLLVVAKLIKAPFFFVAVGSQANIGGAASAPVVAGAFNPVLAPVGVLLAIAGYVMGTYAGLMTITMCRMLSEHLHGLPPP